MQGQILFIVLGLIIFIKSNLSQADLPQFECPETQIENGYIPAYSGGPSLGVKPICDYGYTPDSGLFSCPGGEFDLNGIGAGCKLITCPASAPVNGEVTPASTVLDVAVTYSCNAGFELVGATQRYCRYPYPSGPLALIWEPSMEPYCIVKPLPLNSQFKGGKTNNVQ